MKNIALFLLPFIFSCGTEVTSTVLEKSTPESTYKKWIESRITCQDSVSITLITKKSAELTNIEELRKSSLFDCDFNDYKLLNISSFEIPIDTDTSKIKSFEFDFSICNLTKNDTLEFHRQYAFELEDHQWKLVYFGRQLNEIWASVFQPKDIPDYLNLEKQILEFIELDKYNSDWYYCLAECYSKLADPGKTEMAIKNYLNYSRTIDPYIYCILGNAYRRAGKMEKAIENYHTAVSLSDDASDSACYFTYLNFTYEQMNNSDSASYYSDLAKKMNPEKLIIHGTLGELYAETGQPEKALEKYDAYYQYNATEIGKSDGPACREYMRYLIDKSMTLIDGKPYLLHAREIGQAINPNDIVLKYLKEIDELLDAE